MAIQLPTNTRLVLDTNVLISAFIFKKFAGELYTYCAERFELITSSWILAEFDNKLDHKFKLPDLVRQEIMSRLQADLVIYEPTNELPTNATDPDDNHVLRVALFGDVHFLITGDQKHLLPLSQVGNTKIVSPRDFYQSYIG